MDDRKNFTGGLLAVCAFVGFILYINFGWLALILMVAAAICILTVEFTKP
jgi:diacylglycerol kinase